MSDSKYGEKCDHDPCHCVTTSENAVVEGKTVYCGPGCAEGRGCSHSGCNCGEHSGR